MLHAHNGFLYAGVLLTGMLLGGAAEAAPGQTIQYPPARHSDVVEDYHGTRAPDPYRWLFGPSAAGWLPAIAERPPDNESQQDHQHDRAYREAGATGPHRTDPQPS